MKFVMPKKLSEYCGRKQSPEITRHTRVHVTLKVKETDVQKLALTKGVSVQFLRDHTSLVKFTPIIGFWIKVCQD